MFLNLNSCNGDGADGFFSGGSAASKADTSDSDNTEDDSDTDSDSNDGVDEPTWINGTFLVSCKFESMSGPEEVVVDCGVARTNNITMGDENVEKMTYAWTVSAPNQTNTESDTSSILDSGSVNGTSDSLPGFAFNISGKNARNATIDIVMHNANSESNTISAPFKSTIAGFSPEDQIKLTDCLEIEADPTICFFPADSGVTNTVPEDVIDPPIGAPLTNKRIFYTSNKYDGNMTGTLNIADNICNQLAIDNSLDGSWLALLGTAAIPASSRFNYPEANPLMNLGGQIVLASIQTLFSGKGIVNPIGFDETGTAYVDGGNLAAVGIAIDGGIQSNCADWSDPTQNARVVSINQTNIWLETGTLVTAACSTANLRFICIER